MGERKNTQRVDFVRFMCYNRYIREKGVENMSEIGVIKEFDKLGRLVIPKDLRERYAIDNKVEIVATEQGILIKSPDYVLVKREETQRG